MDLLDNSCCKIKLLTSEARLARAEHAERVEEYEEKITDLLSGKVDTIFQMKEEVESDFSDRMAG